MALVDLRNSSEMALVDLGVLRTDLEIWVDP
jgi:hypothetical protein